MKKTEFSSKTVFPLEKHFYTDMPSSRLNKTTSILEFKNGLYQGDLLDYKRHGKGIYFWDIGQVYIGDWEDDMITGFGICFFPFGGHLYGNFLRNKLNGLGILTFYNGDIFAGYWEAGKLEGKYLCKKKGVWSAKKIGVYTNGKDDTSIEIQKKILHEYYKMKKEIIEKISKELLFQEIYENTPIVINNSPENKDTNKRKIGFLDLNSKAKGLWFYGMLKDGKADGLGLLFDHTVLRCKGVFQDGKLEGIGMQISELFDIYDGVFVEGELYLGVVYDNERKNYVFGQFFKKTLLKIYTEGQGFPFELMPLYKHNVYQINLSYYYKYTSNELVLLNDIDRGILYNLAMFKKTNNFNNTKKCINASPTLNMKNEEKQTKSSNEEENLITFGNDDFEENLEPEYPNNKENQIGDIDVENRYEAMKLNKDPDNNINFIYFLDDGQPFEPIVESPKTFKCQLAFTPKKKKTNYINENSHNIIKSEPVPNINVINNKTHRNTERNTESKENNFKPCDNQSISPKKSEIQLNNSMKKRNIEINDKKKNNYSPLKKQINVKNLSISPNSLKNSNLNKQSNSPNKTYSNSHSKTTTLESYMNKSINLSKKQEEIIKKQWNEKERIMKKNQSLEKLAIMVDDTRFTNKYQVMLNQYTDREFLILNDEACGRGKVHDFTDEIYQKNHNN